MDVRNCRTCGKLFNYIGGQYRHLCPACAEALEDKFVEVKNYIEDNKDAQLTVISQECDVSVRQIEQWVREERLTFSDDSPIGIACEGCGATIKSGRLCDNCRTALASQFSNVYHKEKPKPSMEAKKSEYDKARMRFLENR